ncbi:hypothetical protein HX900_17595 [Rhizobium sp. WYCCWR 11290]|uniref:Uncharacterized protein n=1 Tax=Rhizobium changzhiense TaxID=2692317 RepID=A0A7Z0RNW7_9HYPH|nr:hypothetical protein [Rhizobium changzhiense]NZD62921.1 hypothetical protein [Rhizobium changzhiense]
MADSRPTAVILDARPQIERRIRAYIVWLAMNDVDPADGEIAKVLHFGRDRGAA